jgi:hypothetical protein
LIDSEPNGFELSSTGKNFHKSLTLQNGFAIPARRPKVAHVRDSPESPGVRFSNWLSGIYTSQSLIDTPIIQYYMLCNLEKLLGHCML